MTPMMVRHLLGLALASCALMTVAGQRQTVEVGDTRYLVSVASPYSARLGWVLAYQYCRSQGMELLTQDTQEQAVLLDQYLGTNGYDGESFWTSGNRMGSNQWLWMTTGQPYNSTFSYWSPDPPASGDNTSCMAYQAGKWFPSECTTPMHYICQLTRCFYYTSSSRPPAAAGEGATSGRGGKSNTNAAESTRNQSSSTTPAMPSPSSTVPGIHSLASILIGQRRHFRTGSLGAGGTGRPAVEPILRDTIRALTRLTTAEHASATTSTPKAGATSQDNQKSSNNANNSAAKGTSSASSSLGRQGSLATRNNKIIHFPGEVLVTTLSPLLPLFTTKRPMPQRSATTNHRIIHFPGEVPVSTLQPSDQEERIMTVTEKPHEGPTNATEVENLVGDKELAHKRLFVTESVGPVGDSVNTTEAKSMVHSKKLFQEGLVKEDETITEDDERINEIEGSSVPVLNRLLAPPEPPRTHLNIIGSNVNSDKGSGSVTIQAAPSTNEKVFPALTNGQASEREILAAGVSAAQETPTKITLEIVGNVGVDSFQATKESLDQGRLANESSDVSTTEETTKSGTDGAVGGRGKKLGVRASVETYQLERKETSSWPTVVRSGK